MALSRLVAAGTTLLTLLLAGCASGAGDSPPTGVDGLEVPTPSPDPGDFVDTVDNPWLPLAPGAEWVYERTGERGGTITVTVAEETTEVAGLTATTVSEVVSGGRQERVEVRWYAQDTSGNVWLLGEEGVWEAGVDGARAGLVMPAAPRVGDGFQQEYAEGVAEDRAEVVDLEGGVLVLEQRSPLEPGVVRSLSYTRGTGLDSVVTVSGRTGGLELVDVSGAA